MLKPVLKNPWVQAAMVLLGLALLCLLCYLLSPVLISLLLAFIVAYVLTPVVDGLEKRKIPRGATISVLAIAGAALLVVGPVLLANVVVSEAESLMTAASSRLSEARQEQSGGVSSWVSRHLDSLPLKQVAQRLGWDPANAGDFDAQRALLAERVGAYVKANAADLTFLGQKAGVTLARIFSSIGQGFVRGIVLIANFALFAFVAGYLLKDFNRITKATGELVPPKYRQRTFDIVRQIDTQIRSVLRGQFVVCLCLGAMYAVGLTISGVPFAVLLGVFGGVASIVPYLGVILTIGPALILALLQHGIDWHLVGVLVTFGIAQTIEGTILTPKIVGEQVGLNPVWVILAILVFGGTFGFVGLLIAVPLAASLKVLVLEGVAYYRTSSFFASDESPSGGPGAGV